MSREDYRRQHIQKLIQKANENAAQRGKQIDTVDPIMYCVNKLFPYLPERVKAEYSRTALRIIKESRLFKEESLNDYSQTSLLTFSKSSYSYPMKST